MKVIGIQSSPRGKNSITLKLRTPPLKGPGRQELEMPAGRCHKIEGKEYCTGCASCYRTGGCHIKDDYLALREKRP